MQPVSRIQAIARRLMLCGLLLITLMPFAVQSQGCAGAPPPRLAEDTLAQVTTAGGSNLRRLPGSGHTLLDIIPVDTVLRIRGGPACEQGYTWWQVDYRDNRGWIAEGTPDNYWLRPYEFLVAKADTVEVTVPPELATGLQPRYLPQHVGVRLQGYPVTHPIFEPALRAFPQPPAYDEVQQVRSALFEGADFNPPGSGHSGFINFEDGSGLRYTSVFIDPGNEAIPPAVLYNFRGFSVNGHYLSATFPVEVDSLPLEYDPPLDADPAAYEIEYQQRTQEVLRTTPPQTFTPSLAMLDSMMQSITTSAPPVPLDERIQTFDYRDEAGIFQLSYVPELATDVNSAIVRATDDRPRHLRLILRDYTLENLSSDNLPTIRIYETANLDSDWLVSLQLLLSQQPRNPSRIPMLNTPGVSSVSDEPSGRAQIAYFRFQSGEGLRVLLRYDDRPTWLYVYHGLTDDSRYYVSVLLPVEIAADVSPLDAPPDAFSPRLTWLDNLAESIRLSVPDDTD